MEIVNISEQNGPINNRFTGLHTALEPYVNVLVNTFGQEMGMNKFTILGTVFLMD